MLNMVAISTVVTALHDCQKSVSHDNMMSQQSWTLTFWIENVSAHHLSYQTFVWFLSLVSENVLCSVTVTFEHQILIGSLSSPREIKFPRGVLHDLKTWCIKIKNITSNETTAVYQMSVQNVLFFSWRNFNFILFTNTIDYSWWCHQGYVSVDLRHKIYYTIYPALRDSIFNWTSIQEFYQTTFWEA